MSKKHVDDYFNQICNDYHEMVEALRDMEKECNEGLVSPERVDNLKEMIKPIKYNYQRISYIMFLLNMPNKKEKKRWYSKENKNKNFPQEVTLEGIRQENKKALDAAKKSL